MPSVAESADSLTQFGAAAQAGLEVLSLDQTIVFTRYVRKVMPLDGYVFWINAALATPARGGTLKVKGSLHRTAINNQVEDATYGQNRIVFTSEQEVDDFNDIAPDVMYLAEFDGVRFSFNALRSLYRQANLFHYTGDAVYSFMESQIIDTPDQLAGLELTVSNSLPIWLAMGLAPQVFPSFLVDQNIPPPYGSIHIEPSLTQAIQAVPRIDNTSSHWQLATDHVRITLYGLNNRQALAFQDAILAYMSDDDHGIGLMNMPIMRDDKRPQSELNVIAMRKTIEFDVSYYQAQAYDIGRKFIISCVPTFTIVNP